MVLIVGASGNVGPALARLLLQRGTAFRTACQVPKTSGTGKLQCDVQLDFSDPATFNAALDGCDAVFLVRPPAISNTRKTLKIFVDVSRRTGIRHIVFLSVVGADKHAWVPHPAVENHLRAGVLDWTILRPSFVAQNLGNA